MAKPERARASSMLGRSWRVPPPPSATLPPENAPCRQTAAHQVPLSSSPVEKSKRARIQRQGLSSQRMESSRRWRSRCRYRVAIPRRAPHPAPAVAVQPLAIGHEQPHQQRHQRGLPASTRLLPVMRRKSASSIRRGAHDPDSNCPAGTGSRMPAAQYRPQARPPCASLRDGDAAAIHARAVS